MSNSKKLIENSVNVSDVTNLISTYLLVTEANMPNDGEWTKSNFNDQDWSKIQIPSYQIVQDKKFKEGNYAYYRIKLPKIAFEKLSSLQNESSLALSVIFFNRLDIVLNGSLFKTNKPSNSAEANVIVPIKEGQDNIICLKAHIVTGDTGIDHRDKILLGKSAELNALYGADYKTQTAFQLVFILCKGSILFIFALIFLLLKVETSFEKFFIFGLCALVEELIAGEYLYGPLNFNQMVYLYNFVNVGATTAVFLFFAELLKNTYSKKIIRILFAVLLIVSTLLAMDALYLNFAVDLTTFMKSWNLMTVSILIYYLPKVIKFDRILFVGLLTSVVLYFWGTLPTNNIGLNYKAYGNLLLFIMVAYQTFSLFRREQIQLHQNERKLLEQEKDVAIGRTANLLAHDVRKPLEQMKLVIDRMMNGQADNDFLEIARIDLDFSLNSVNQQVSDIVNYGKNSNVSLQEISFYKLLSHSIKQIMSIHQEMDLEIEYDFKARMCILGDSSRLTGALVNLISNAVEAIRDIGNRYQGKIIFSTTQLENEFVFHVFNNGPEIPTHLLKDIFKPFFTNGKTNGTGLGLSSVLKAVNEHEGRLEVKNIPGEGVKFSLRLKVGQLIDDPSPYKFLNSSKLYSYTQLRYSPVNEKPSMRFFLFQNNLEIINYFETLATSLPFKPIFTIAKDFDSASDMVRKSRFDIYFLSIDLGGIDLYKQELNFLTHEVLLCANPTEEKPLNLSCDYITNNLKPELFKAKSIKVFNERIKILFVDDTKLFRIAWQMFHGDSCIQCLASPEEALEFAADSLKKIDVFVLDYYYSNSSLNGEELAKRIQLLRPLARVLISSSSLSESSIHTYISKSDFEVRRFSIRSAEFIN